MTDEIEPIPMDWVEGADETTIWLWPDTPDPVTVRLSGEKWSELQEASSGDVERYVTELIVEDLGFQGADRSA